MNVKKFNKHRVFTIIQIGDKSDILSRGFDLFISATIIINIIVLFLQTFNQLESYYTIFHIIEIATILIFSFEYILRIWTSEYLHPKSKYPVLKFMFSFNGIVDLLAILPFFFLSGFIVFRMLRIFRILHLFKLNSQYDSFNVIVQVLKEKKNQITSSVMIILILLLASSLCMYSVENIVQPENFSNAFSGIWWATSTLLTVGYGDIYPITTLGKLMAIVIAFLGVGVVAIPTGIISAGFVEEYTKLKDGINENIPYLTFTITEKHSWKNKEIKNVLIPEGIQILFVLRGNEILKKNIVFQNNDEVFLSSEYYIPKNIDVKREVLSENHKWIEHSMNNIDLSRLIQIVFIQRKHKIIVPTETTIFKKDDILFLYEKQFI